MSAPALRIVCTFQSTLSVRRATLRAVPRVDDVAISIHALRKESDLDSFSVGFIPIISIHALRKESDVSC